MRAALILTTCIGLGMMATANAAPKNRSASFAKLPDWSGVWERFDVGPSGAPSDPQEFKGFIAAMMELRPPFNAEWQMKYDQALNARLARHEPPQLQCNGNGLGFPMGMLSPFELMQFLMTSGETAVLFYTGGARHIMTHGYVHPAIEERYATLFGDSVGHWEGHVLIVDTVASSGLIYTADEQFTPLSDQVHIVERIRNIDANTLLNQMAIDDPVAFAHPWNLSVVYHRVKGMAHVIAAECTSVDRNPVVNGEFTISPPVK